jgi:dCTP diphosphatase
VTSMNDSDTTLAQLRELVREFRDRRGWARFHTPKNLSMAIAVEAAELMELFQWLGQDEAWELAEDAGRLQMMSEELADVLIYALSFAEALQLDVATAVVDKLAMNAKKYPEDDDWGTASWLDRIKGGDT